MSELTDTELYLLTMRVRTKLTVAFPKERLRFLFDNPLNVDVLHFFIRLIYMELRQQLDEKTTRHPPLRKLIFPSEPDERQ